jgi:signal transduction histidine kinase
VSSDGDGARQQGRLANWLAASNLLFVLPIVFFVAVVVLWQWTLDNERERIRLLTSEEASRVASALADRLQGHADTSARAGNRWLLREPYDQDEWDEDLYSRRWLNPELETVEWLDADLNARWWPSNQEPVAARIVSPDDLTRSGAEHRVVLAGPSFDPEGDPVSVTIVPLEQADDTVEWVVAVYDLQRVLRFTLQGASSSFALALVADERELFVSHVEDRSFAEGWERAIDLGYDQLSLRLHVWPRAVTLEGLRTELPQMALIGGLLATVVLALGIRLAQVSSRRAMESRMTESLQAEVRARKLAEKSLERKLHELSRSNQEFERFAYAISHDLRDPLNAIHLNVQAVLSHAAHDLAGEDRRRLENGAKAVSRLDAMIGRLLEYARAGGGVNGLELVDSAEAFEDAIANLQGLVDEHHATVTSGALPKVIAHRAALARLFQNLVSNAIKYRGDDPPEVNVEAVKGDEEWIFSVADNARGMEDKQIAKAFDLFWRHQDGGATAGEGIGLAVCKRIVERHGGRIWIESSPGEGTTFFFSWPADPDVVSGQRLSARRG